MSDLPRNFWDALADISQGTVRRVHDENLAKTDSPIEALFATAAVYLLRLQSQVYHLSRQGDAVNIADEVKWIIETQAPLGAFRVDFLITYRSSDGPRSIVVECDGHDFHERTKEQAARDRARDRDIQKMGYKIFRFTGSELYRNAFDCAAQAMLSIMRLDDGGRRS